LFFVINKKIKAKFFFCFRCRNVQPKDVITLVKVFTVWTVPKNKKHQAADVRNVAKWCLSTKRNVKHASKKMVRFKCQPKSVHPWFSKCAKRLVVATQRENCIVPIAPKLISSKKNHNHCNNVQLHNVKR
jgi:hypothetical protein